MIDALMVLFWPVTVAVMMVRSLAKNMPHWLCGTDKCKWCKAGLGERHHDTCLYLNLHEMADFWDTQRDADRYFTRRQGTPPWKNGNVI